MIINKREISLIMEDLVIALNDKVAVHLNHGPHRRSSVGISAQV